MDGLAAGPIADRAGLPADHAAAHGGRAVRHITRGKALGPALLKLLGYDTDLHRVKSFTIHWRATEAPLIRITEYATVEQEQAIVDLAEEYAE